MPTENDRVRLYEPCGRRFPDSLDLAAQRALSWFGGVSRTQIPGEMMVWVASDCQSGDGKMLLLPMPPRHTSRCQNRPSRCGSS